MKKKILLVDDKATIGKVASIYLGKDYDVMYLENPIKAIDWLNEGNVPDLIISDIRMPLMRGDEFLRYMKANELFKSIPIVMLSSEESTTERIKLLEEGAEDYISEAIQSFGTKNPNQKDYRLIQPLNAIFCLHRQTQQNNRTVFEIKYRSILCSTKLL